MLLYETRNIKVRHTRFSSELGRFPIGECIFCDILLGFPGGRIFFSGSFVVFPVDLILNPLANHAFCKNGADLVKYVLVDVSVGMERGRGSTERS
jgi:hypothetical protein